MYMSILWTNYEIFLLFLDLMYSQVDGDALQ